jgi:hypothetical protein
MLTRDERDQRNRKLADMFRWAYEEWRKLAPRERAAVSRAARLNLGNLRRSNRSLIVFNLKRRTH